MKAFCRPDTPIQELLPSPLPLLYLVGGIAQSSLVGSRDFEERDKRQSTATVLYLSLKRWSMERSRREDDRYLRKVVQ